MKTMWTFALLIFLSACGSFLDIAGKGEKTDCLKLSTGDMKISCNCAGKQITSMAIYSNKNAKELFGNRIAGRVFKPATDTFDLPVPKDSADRHFLQIEIQLTNSHHRESYSILTKPGDFSRIQLINSRYFSH